MQKMLFWNSVLTILVMLLLSFSAVALVPCQSGELTTSIHKDYQMIYQNESFLRIDNKDALKDIEQLKSLTCLQYLDATEGGLIGDIANLKELKNLEVLSLYGNPEVYGDICALSGLTKLRVLKFAFDPKVYGDISCLKDINLETFAMTYTNISGNLSDLSHMNKLKAVYVSGTSIAGDVSSLSQLTSIEELGISDEYPGNPNIAGDLAVFDNFTLLKKVSLYSTKATNCEHFTQVHSNIPQGGCSKESLKTLRVHNIRAEKKIGKDRYERPPPDYTNGTGQNEAGDVTKESGQENFFAKLWIWIKSLFGKNPSSESALPEILGGGPPRECIINGKFIGKDECKTLMEKSAPKGEPDGGPPQKCIVDGKFIGKERCMALMESSPSEEGKGWCQSEEECDILIKETLNGKK